MPRPKLVAEEPTPVAVPEDVVEGADVTAYKKETDPLAWTQGVEETKVQRYCELRECIIKPQVKRFNLSIRRSKLP